MIETTGIGGGGLESPLGKVRSSPTERSGPREQDPKESLLELTTRQDSIDLQSLLEDHVSRLEARHQSTTTSGAEAAASYADAVVEAELEDAAADAAAVDEQADAEVSEATDDAGASEQADDQGGSSAGGDAGEPTPDDPADGGLGSLVDLRG